MIGKKIPGILICIVCTGLLIYTTRRDFLLQKDESGDLRNRIVGARLTADGRSPYFYKWTPSDGIRTYDPQNFDTLKVSNITATPFFHKLINPVAAATQKEISLCWFILEYILLSVMTGMTVLLAETAGQRFAIVLVSMLFLFTDAWKMHIYNGQYYLLIPFLAMTVFYLLQRQKGFLGASAAGLAAIVLVLIRPNTILFFVPFLFLIRKYSRTTLISFFIPVLVLAGWTIGDKQQRFLWQDYQRAIGEQIKLHQNLHPAIQDNAPDPNFTKWEGIHYTGQDEDSKNIHSENGNFFVLVKNIFHYNLPVDRLLILSMLVILVLTVLYYYRQGGASKDFNPVKTVLLGYSLYMVSDLFSPFYRHQYYTVQCLFPLLLSCVLYRPSLKWVYGLLATGIFLNIGRIRFIKMEHTIGEYLILSATLLLVMMPDEKQAAQQIKNTQ
ncbi:MAG: hypothetical protein P4L51_13265 [Puia sp.]|nr:hypothetical protein [Puia sp.]